MPHLEFFIEQNDFQIRANLVSIINLKRNVPQCGCNCGFTIESCKRSRGCPNPFTQACLARKRGNRGRVKILLDENVKLKADNVRLKAQIVQGLPKPDPVPNPNAIIIRFIKNRSTFVEKRVITSVNVITRTAPTVPFTVSVKVQVWRDNTVTKLLKQQTKNINFGIGNRDQDFNFITNVDTDLNSVFVTASSPFGNTDDITITRAVIPPPPPPTQQSVSFEIKFVDLPNENFSSNVSEADFERIREEARQNGRWSSRLLARVDLPAQFTFEQVIRTIDAILAKPLPMDGCGVGFHRDENGLCVPDEPEPDEERNLFNTAIIGAIGIGVLASMMGNKK